MTKKERVVLTKCLEEARASIRADVLLDYPQDKIPQSIDPRILLDTLTKTIDKMLASL